MRQTRAIELGTGLFVLFGFAALLFMVNEITSERFGIQSAGYQLSAEFDNIGGLKVGAPVSMAGVTIGRVARIEFNPKDFRALVRLRIDPQYNSIPNDSDAAIFTQGLLGSQYIGMTAGGSETPYKDRDHIELTQSALVLENLISKFLVNFAEGKSKSAEESSK
jgi:phospholipid/cholesterol/gamma-HCH transport system substrate-binding protein